MQKLASILLVDDDVTNNFLNEALLTSMGVTEQVLVVEDGEKALAALTAPNAVAPALLLLDVGMPVMGGFEFLEAYQRLPEAQQKATIIVMLTVSMDARDLLRIEELPIAGLVSKPLTEEKVNTIMQLHFQRHL